MTGLWERHIVNKCRMPEANSGTGGLTGIAGKDRSFWRKREKTAETTGGTTADWSCAWLPPAHAGPGGIWW